MKTWTRFEQRWCDTLLRAMLPKDDPATIDALELEQFWGWFEEHGSTLFRLGFRAAVWLLTLLPLFTGGGRTFPRLDEDARDAHLRRLASANSYLVRQSVLTVKMVACFAWFHSPDVRRRIPGVRA